MRAVLVANAEDIDPGLVGRALRAHGYSFVEYVRELHTEWDTDGTVDGGVSLVVSLGSSWSTYWDDVRPAVSAEQRLIADAISRGTPVLGICFGAQQLATVLGGSVSRAPEAEIGWHRVRPVDEAALDVPRCLHSGPWMQWHYDRFTVPPGATALAESAVGPQAFRVGRSLGLQFHPEATESIVSMWSRGAGAEELQSAGIDPDDMMATTRANVADAEARCERLIEWFLSEVAQLHIPR